MENLNISGGAGIFPKEIPAAVPFPLEQPSRIPPNSMKTGSLFLATLAVAGGLVSSVLAKDAQVTDFRIGSHISGPEVDLSKLAGKVVVLEYWGVNCPPCVAALPELAKMDKRYRDDGLVMIGAECQGSSEEAIGKLTKKARVEYTIVSGASGPVQVNGIPHAVVFDPSGKMIWNGNPHDSEFEKTVKRALKDAEEGAIGEEEEDAPAVRAGNLIESQTWTNSDGKEIKAAVKSAGEDQVVFLIGGREVPYPLAKLSDDSREKIEEARDAAAE